MARLARRRARGRGPGAGAFPARRVIDGARQKGAPVPYSANTPYLNTIPVEKQPPHPGDRAIEHRIRSVIRWNAIAIVLRANKDILRARRPHRQLPVGRDALRHRLPAFLARADRHPRRRPDLHPGPLAPRHLCPRLPRRPAHRRAAAELPPGGRRQGPVVLSASLADAGLLAVPHRLDGPRAADGDLSGALPELPARPRARRHRANRKVWAFLGDGEMDEPEIAGRHLARRREKLDNLIFVINCNLQRLDGPVRGNGKIVQELEAAFRGAGWNVIKVLWGTAGTRCSRRTPTACCCSAWRRCVDGEYQDFKSKNGAYVREHFFGKYPETAALVADMSDDQIWALDARRPRSAQGLRRLRGGGEAQGPADRDPRQDRQGLRHGRGGRRPEHHPPAEEDGRDDAARVPRPLPAADLRRAAHRGAVPPLRPRTARRWSTCASAAQALGGYLPARRPKSSRCRSRRSSAFEAQLKATEGREISTTMAFVRILNTLLRDKQIGKRVVPIVPDESRTFGMEGMFRQFGIFCQVGQLYQPEDAEQLMYYKEDKNGQILQEGINEPGAMSSWIAAATSYSSIEHADDPVLHLLLDVRLPARRRPRLGGRRHAGARLPDRRHGGPHDAERRGPAARGRPQPYLRLDDPELRSYDPTFAYEVAVIVQDGLRRMFAEQEDVFYYLTVMNENYEHPAMPEGVEADIIKGMYLFREGQAGKGKERSCARAAAGHRHDPARGDRRGGPAGGGLRRRVATSGACPSFTELRREAIDVERWNLLHPTEAPRRAMSRRAWPAAAGRSSRRPTTCGCLPTRSGPGCRGATRCSGPTASAGRTTAEAAPLLRGRPPLGRGRGAEGAGRRRRVETSVVAEAINKYGLDPSKPTPMTV